MGMGVRDKLVSFGALVLTLVSFGALVLVTSACALGRAPSAEATVAQDP